MPVTKVLQIIVYSTLALIMFSCEGFKFIAVENKSKADIAVTMQPGVETPELFGNPETYKKKFDTLLIFAA
jgi:hypothetical protein